MKCKHCKSEWKTDGNISASLTSCPFCGASFADADDSGSRVYDNSGDALACIMRVHGADVLLGGTLKNFFTDYAPRIAVLRKNVVFSVYSSGAAGILKSGIAATHGKYMAITWAKCELRGYLNGAFLQTFSGAEQSQILRTTNTNADNGYMVGGSNTAGRVFLLSIDEAVRYFGDNKDRIAKYENQADWWWFRSPGSFDSYYAAFVSDDGGVRDLGIDVRNKSGGVRPALWLNLES